MYESRNVTVQYIALKLVSKVRLGESWVNIEPHIYGRATIDRQGVRLSCHRVLRESSFVTVFRPRIDFVVKNRQTGALLATRTGDF